MAPAFLHGFCSFLLTRPSRDVTFPASAAPYIVNISTHTSLAGRDGVLNAVDTGGQDFYSHDPRGT